MKFWLLLALAAILLFSGCIEQLATPTTTCPANYMKIANDCCLDANGNGICDRDETSTVSNTVPQTKTIEDQVRACSSNINCLIRLALETNDAAVCSEVPNQLSGFPDPRDCLTQLAVRYNNPSYCQIIEPSFRQDCLARLSSTNASCPPASCPAYPTINVSAPANLSLTDRLVQCRSRGSEDDQVSCMTALALETDTPSICKTLMYDFSYDKGNCYILLAIKYKNRGYCDLAPYSYIDSCKSKVNDSLVK